jgi:CheY-like chemotaxis protein
MDDDEVVLQVVGAMLEDLGYEVELALDGQAAISRYADAWQSARSFDAVIMDLTVSGSYGQVWCLGNNLKRRPC